MATSPKTLLKPRHISSVGVWGACFDQGQPHVGTGDAPGLLRSGGLANRLEQLGHEVVEYGDLLAEGRDEVMEVMIYWLGNE